jgi:hypothetical protein
MTITVASAAMFLAILQLLLAAIGVPGFSRWAWFPGGMAFWGIALFMQVNVH